MSVLAETHSTEEFSGSHTNYRHLCTQVAAGKTKGKLMAFTANFY